MLDELFETVGCMYLSDLKYAGRNVKMIIARIIERKYPAETVSLHEWNDALFYLTGSPPESSSQLARRKLLNLLRGGC